MIDAAYGCLTVSARSSLTGLTCRCPGLVIGAVVALCGARPALVAGHVLAGHGKPLPARHQVMHHVVVPDLHAARVAEHGDEERKGRECLDVAFRLSSPVIVVARGQTG